MELETVDLSTFVQQLQSRVARGAPDDFEPESLEFVTRREELDFRVTFVPEGKLLFAVRATPRHPLLLCLESGLTQHLDQLGISGEVKLGNPEFDARFVIKNATQDQARETLDDHFLEVLRGLEPFVELEMTQRGYRLLKTVEATYGAARMSADLDRLEQLVRRTLLAQEGE